MARLLALIQLLLFISLSAQTMSTISTLKRVAVVGMGPAGIAAGITFPKHEYAVRMFDKGDVGGKCFTIRGSNRESKDCGYTEVGAIQVGVGYKYFLEQLRNVGIPLRKTWDSFTLQGQQGRPVFTPLGEYYWPLKDLWHYPHEASVMSAALKRFEPYMANGYESIPEGSEFTMSFEDWADMQGLHHFKEDYRVWITSYGYGLLSEVSAFRALSLINSSWGLIAFRMGNMNLRQVSCGYGNALKQIADYHNLDMQTHVTIDRIIRNHDNVVINYQKDGQHFSEEFDHLVMACGLSCAKELFGEENLTTEEKTLIANLRYRPYDVAIATIDNLPKGGYVLPDYLATPGHVSLMSKNSGKNDDVVIYVPRGGASSLDNPIPPLPETEFKARILEDLNAYGLTGIDFKHIQYWSFYSPHFTEPQSYKLLTQIQGQNNTIYTTSESGFEIVERAWEVGKSLVERIFLGVAPQEESYFEAFMRRLTTGYEYINSADKHN